MCWYRPRMHTPAGVGRRFHGGPNVADAPVPLGSESPEGAEPAPVPRPARRRRLTVAVWLGGGLALTVLFVRISLTARVMSDGANNALQAWDMLHGHLLLHGWQIGDANYYFLELPLMALAEALFGLGDLAEHVSSALTYTLITAAADRDRRDRQPRPGAGGPRRGGARGDGRTAVRRHHLPGPRGTRPHRHLPVHPRLGPADRPAPARRLTAPLLLVILTAGQFEDLTVRYVAVPAIIAVCAYRALAARSLRSPDTLLAGTALVSVPLSALFSKLLGAPRRVHHRPPAGRTRTRSPVAASCAGHLANIRVLFGGANAWRTSRQAGKPTSA